MLSINTKLTPHVDVVSTTLDNGEGVLMHLATANYFSLNQTGTRIWALLGEGLTLHEVAATLVTEYEVTDQQAQHSVLILAQALTDHDLLVNT